MEKRANGSIILVQLLHPTCYKQSNQAIAVGLSERFDYCDEAPTMKREVSQLNHIPESQLLHQQLSFLASRYYQFHQSVGIERSKLSCHHRAKHLVNKQR